MTEPASLRLPAYRDQFLLRPDAVFLNHGSFGACPRPVFDACQRWQLELERQPVEFLHYRFKERMQWARAALAAFLGSGTDDLVFMPNSTTALNVVARSLASGLDTDDEVLATDHEYGALDKTWRFLCGRHQARYVRAPLPMPAESVGQVVDAMWTHVNERTRILFLSHITSPTALILPVGPLIQRARAAGILTVIDGSHAPGQVPLDLSALGPDFYAGNCHKWMCAPKGSAFLYARPEAQSRLAPLIVSWGWPGSFVEEQQWQGTRDVAAFLAVPAAVGFLREHRWPEVQEACHALVSRAREALEALSGLPPLAPNSPAWYAQMASVPVPFAEPEVVRTRLWNEFGIEAPIMAWNGRSLLRVSIQCYNSERDIDALLSAVACMLAGKARP